MNRLIDISIRLIGYAIILLLVSSCISERLQECPQEAQSQLTLHLVVEGMSPLRASTEAGVDALNENKIEHIQILFYHEGTLYWSVTPQVRADGSCSIPIPENKQSDFDGQNLYDIYAVTNVAITAPNMESDLQNIVITESVAGLPNTKFVMLGKVSKRINFDSEEGKKLGEVGLRRIACKLRIKPDVNISGYTQQGPMKVHLVGAVDRGYLINQSNAVAAQQINYEDRSVENHASQTFYSYYLNWSGGSNVAPYYLLAVPLQKDGAEETLYYSYRVSIAPTAQEFVSNKLYDLTVHINRIGSSIPEDPVNISGSLTVKPWEKKDDEYDLPASNYIEVSERVVYMFNIEDYTITYQTSQTPVSITIDEVSYSYVNGATGNQTTEPVGVGSDQYPSVELKPETKSIEINSILPINNVPKKIRFTVSNGISGMNRDVTVYQFPPRFIVNTTGIASSLRPNGDFVLGESHLNNKAIYRITTQTPLEGVILGFPPMEKKNFYSRTGVGGLVFSYKYSIEHTDYTTKTDEETARMVSPSFELASQLGATSVKGYSLMWGNTSYLGYLINSEGPNGALLNCAVYTETREVNGVNVVLDDWRLPTEAEIRLVDRLQNDSNSAVKSIMTGHYYWGASDKAAVKLQGGSHGSASSAYVRCVRDVKDNTLKNKGSNILDR